jgi:uncharacterized coiled-coil DUF342 family protein
MSKATELAEDLERKKHANYINGKLVDSVVSELRRLHAENEALKNKYDVLADAGLKVNRAFNELQTDAAELRIENEALRKDAGRYRELRSTQAFMVCKKKQEQFGREEVWEEFSLAAFKKPPELN